MKPRIHFHSDCDFFGGCENMLSVLFGNEKFRNEFDVSFSYGYSKEYDEGLDKRLKIPVKRYPIKTVLRYRGHKSGAYIFILKALNNVFKYVYFAKNVYAINRAIKKERPDIVHINNGGYPGAYSCSAAVYASRLAGVERIIYVVNNTAFSGFSIRRKLDFWIDHYLAKNVSVFITGSLYAGKKLREVLWFDEKKYLNMPNTIFPRKADETPEETRKRLGIGNDEIIICNVSLLEERRGHKYIIMAFKELLEEFGGQYKLRLILEGNGPSKKDLEALASEYSLGDRMLFVEEKNVYNLFNALDIFVMASIALDDFPNVILEVMSVGKPVVGSRFAGIPEQVTDGINGYLFEPKNVEELKNALKKLLMSEDLRKRMGEESKRIFNESFRQDIIVERYIGLYKSLLKEKIPLDT